MPRKPSPFVALLADFQQACAEHQLGWYLFGAQAALLYGSPRLTADADLTVQLGHVPVEALVDALIRHGFDLRISDAAFVRTTRVLPIIHRSSAFPADVVLGGPGLEEAFLAQPKTICCQRSNAYSSRRPSRWRILASPWTCWCRVFSRRGSAMSGHDEVRPSACKGLLGGAHAARQTVTTSTF